MASGQRRLGSIVVADIVGFSAKAQRDEPAALAVLRVFAELVAPLFQNHHVRFSKSLGDGFLVEFPSALESVLCAVEIQKAIANHNALAPSEANRFSVRIGIHVGDVQSIGGDVFGDGVNLASRIHTLAEPGGICVSEDVYRQVSSHRDLQFLPLGGPPLKNIHRSLELYRLELEPNEVGVVTTFSDDFTSIAVLPFANFSPDPDNQHFCDGLSDELISALTKIRKLRVVSRTSSFALKGTEKSVREIGELLGVQILVEGSVRKAANRIRVTVQVIDVASDAHLWTDQYDRDLKDIFALQEMLTEEIVSALKIAITPEERQAMAVAGTKDANAYELYLQGLDQFWRFNIPGLRAARSLFREAIGLDPKFVRAYSGLAHCAAYHFFFWSDHTMSEDAQWAAQRMMELAPNASETVVAQGLAHLIHGKLNEAKELFVEAVERDPQSYDAWYALARCQFSLGAYSESIDAYEQAAEVRIDDFQSLSLAMVSCRSLGDEDRRREIAERVHPKLARHLRLHPDDPRAGYFEASVLGVLGHTQDGVDRLERTIALGPNDQTILYNSACVFCLLGFPERALDCLTRAVDAGFADPDWLDRDMDLRDLRQHPAFLEILQQTKANRSIALES